MIGLSVSKEWTESRACHHTLCVDYMININALVIDRLLDPACYQLLLLGQPRLMAVSALVSDVRVQE